MNELLSIATNNINWIYIVISTLVTYLLLSKLIINPSRTMKLLTTISVNIIVGVLFYTFNHDKLTTLILSFLIQTTFYDYILKTVLTKLNIDYNNGKGII